MTEQDGPVEETISLRDIIEHVDAILERHGHVEPVDEPV